MFIGRKNELKKLNKLHRNDRFECVVIYGRRRVGKTTLINEFIKNKDAIYFTGLETDSKDNLENLSHSIMRQKLGEEDSLPVFSSYQEALDSVYETAKEKRIVLVIDEYPYLAQSYSGMSSLLQVQIDEKYKDSKLMLILCGSSMSFMENQVLGYQSPLYGRRTAQFKIEPFKYYEVSEYFPNSEYDEQALLYSITGGIPQYLGFMDKEKSVEENIKDNFFDPVAYLYEEPGNLLKQEAREPSRYNAIIRAIATGSSRVAEISSKTDMESSAVTTYLNNLVSLGIIRKETPITEKTSRKTIYLIDDGMFRFWYRFVSENASLIQNGMADRVWKKVSPQISTFMGAEFEEICKQWLWKQNAAGALPFEFTELGRWWGNDPVKKAQAEIDILAVIDEHTALFGECKWTNGKVDIGILKSLIERSGLFRYPQKRYILFSKSGFTEGCIVEAKHMNVVLITLTDLYTE